MDGVGRSLLVRMRGRAAEVEDSGILDHHQVYLDAWSGSKVTDLRITSRVHERDPNKIQATCPHTTTHLDDFDHAARVPVIVRASVSHGVDYDREITQPAYSRFRVRLPEKLGQDFLDDSGFARAGNARSDDSIGFLLGGAIKRVLGDELRQAAIEQFVPVAKRPRGRSI